MLLSFRYTESLQRKCNRSKLMELTKLKSQILKKKKDFYHQGQGLK